MYIHSTFLLLLILASCSLAPPPPTYLRVHHSLLLPPYSASDIPRGRHLIMSGSVKHFFDTSPRVIPLLKRVFKSTKPIHWTSDEEEQVNDWSFMADRIANQLKIGLSSLTHLLSPILEPTPPFPLHLKDNLREALGNLYMSFPYMPTLSGTLEPLGDIYPKRWCETVGGCYTIKTKDWEQLMSSKMKYDAAELLKIDRTTSQGFDRVHRHLKAIVVLPRLYHFLRVFWLLQLIPPTCESLKSQQAMKEDDLKGISRLQTSFPIIRIHPLSKSIERPSPEEMDKMIEDVHVLLSNHQGATSQLCSENTRELTRKTNHYVVKSIKNLYDHVQICLEGISDYLTEMAQRLAISDKR
ncbi:MAG: hypothetical protein DHS80DRAFT_21203 [Piptocephalis tieghemiana]|nr:MAG: hypothetical protein DHS80DRAFT_21203 [Piptocephalis tieghemiana]